MTSPLYPGENILSLNSMPPQGVPASNAPAQGMPGEFVSNTGRVARDWNQVPRGALPGATVFPGPVVPRNQWTAKIRAMEQNKRRLSDTRLQANIASLQQDQTLYCWTNALLSAMMIVQAQQGPVITRLSPASVAAPIKNYQNRGGFGGEALEYIIKNGVCSQALWPPNAINPNYDTPASRADRLNHKISDWWELDRRSFDQLITLLLAGIPVAIGLNRFPGMTMGHEVCALDPVILGPDSYGVRIWNSWGDGWGFRGMSVLTEQEATPDDAVAPAAV